MTRQTAIVFGLISSVGALAFYSARKKPTKVKETVTIVPPPPDAVWLKPDTPAATYETGGYVLTGTAGGAPTLDAGLFLDERFGPLPEAQKPTSSQLARIYEAFTALGVDRASGKVRVRPSSEAVNQAYDLAAAFDIERAPEAVGNAVRDFAKAAWQQLPQEKKA
ncbi:MAG: hypothetical protein PHX83_14520 [Acidobacteriia bacterium]|nr:hypothetical protein [Terriglobia bacterium]